MPNLEKQSLTDSERRAYEAYLLATDDTARQEAIAKLVPGSAIYYHLWFLERFRLHAGKPFTAEETEKYDSFKKKYERDQRFEDIKARFLLLQYDHALSEDTEGSRQRRDKLLNEIIGQYLKSLSFNHSRPEGDGGSNHHSSSDNDSEDYGGEGEESEQESQNEDDSQKSDNQDGDGDSDRSIEAQRRHNDRSDREVEDPASDYGQEQ